jgi:hypothetical protein
VNDGNNETWTPGEIEDALNDNRVELRYEKLDTVKSIASGGVVTYVTFDAPGDYSHFDTAAAVYDSNYDALTPVTKDLINGRWTFSTEPTRPVYVVGYSYDIYGAAADLLEERGAMLAEDISSFSSVNGSFSYANKRGGPLELAAQYRKRSRQAMKAVTLYRSDMTPLR